MIHLTIDEPDSIEEIEPLDEAQDIHQVISHERVGYNGYLVCDYGKIVINILSKAVLEQIRHLSRRLILSFWGITGADERSAMGGLVEDLFWDDLKRPYKMRTYQMTRIKDRESFVKESFLDVGKCEHIEGIRLEELGGKVFNTDTSVIARMKKNEGLIDFAGPHRKVFQVTVSDHHKVQFHGLRKLFEASGHINIFENTSKKSILLPKNGRISYYWVVPTERESVWKSKAPKRILTKRGKETVGESITRRDVASCLEQYVDQYVLVMDYVPIESGIASIGLTSAASDHTPAFVKNDMSTAPSVSITKMKKMTVRELKDQCRTYKLKVSGNKTELIERLLFHVGSISSKT